MAPGTPVAQPNARNRKDTAINRNSGVNRKLYLSDDGGKRQHLSFLLFLDCLIVKPGPLEDTDSQSSCESGSFGVARVSVARFESFIIESDTFESVCFMSGSIEVSCSFKSATYSSATIDLLRFGFASCVSRYESFRIDTVDRSFRLVGSLLISCFVSFNFPIISVSVRMSYSEYSSCSSSVSFTSIWLESS